jgi:hypothetical protein
MHNQQTVSSQCQKLEYKLQIDQGATAPAEWLHVGPQTKYAEMDARHSTHHGPSEGTTDVAAET